MALRRAWWKYGRALAVPLLLWGLVIGSLWEPVQNWLGGSQKHDESILREWIENSRGNLPGLVEEYRRLCEEYQELSTKKDPTGRLQLELLHQREKIHEHLASLAIPLTKMYSDQTPLFPKIYRIEVRFDNEQRAAGTDDDREETPPSASAANNDFPRGNAGREKLYEPIVWDSHLPSDDSMDQDLPVRVGPHAQVLLRYQLHAYDKRHREESQRADRVRRLSLLAIIASGLAGAWVVYAQRREGQRERQRVLAQVQVDQAERLLLQEEVRRQEAERRQQQAERDLLQQRLAAQEYEQKMLELKSQLYASIGIMAGSYAHNIKNLLVRPNDLLRRCLEVDGISGEQRRMLQEVRQTLGTVTERLQQILSTVRRDPNRSEMAPLDLCAVLRNLSDTWTDLAWEKWKLQLTHELPEGPLWMEGDLSHLQQAVENLLFNARDATFEMRNHLRDEARRADLDAAQRRQALIDAAAWKGSVEVRARREAEAIVLEVHDNGVGMTEEVRKRCTETHFSTKRDNAAYEGHSTGMGLGLSFVQVVLENHKAQLEIDSAPLAGAVFRVRFPVPRKEANKADGRPAAMEGITERRQG